MVRMGIVRWGYPRANSSISAMQPPCYSFEEEIVILRGNIWKLGSLVWRDCNPVACTTWRDCNPVACTTCAVQCQAAQLHAELECVSLSGLQSRVFNAWA